MQKSTNQKVSKKKSSKFGKTAMAVLLVLGGLCAARLAGEDVQVTLVPAEQVEAQTEGQMPSQAAEESQTGGLEEGEGALPAQGEPAISAADWPLPQVDLDGLLYDSYGQSFIEVNGNVPFLAGSDSQTLGFVSLSDQDNLGRSGPAAACLGPETLPQVERGSIGMMKPSGWTYNGKSNNNRYDFVDGQYVYNRCHLIAYALAGDNSPENLITGTRALNLAMKTFEVRTVRYIEKTGNHVLYRSTPLYEGEEPIARGVLTECWSAEDEGELSFCVFFPNAQPGVFIDYATGENWAAAE